MTNPRADSKLLWLLCNGFVLFSFRALLSTAAFFISFIRFVFETKGMVLSTYGSHGTSLGSSTSRVWFSRKASIESGPPNSSSKKRLGAGFTCPIWLNIFLRIITMLPHIRPPFVRPYLSIANDFIQLQEQKCPEV